MNMNDLNDLRKEVSSVDDEIINLLLDRFCLTHCIGRIKRKLNIPIENLDVEESKLADIPDKLKSIYQEIFKVSKQCQSTIE